jgi:hypothetical protein
MGRAQVGGRGWHRHLSVERRWFIDAVYVSGGKTGKEGRMANGVGDGDGWELDPEAKLAWAEQLLFECIALEDKRELER